MQNQILSLDTVTNADMIKAVQKRYEESQVEHERLSEQKKLLENEQTHLTAVRLLQQNWKAALKSWETLKRDEKRSILFAFIDRIEALGTKEKGLTLTVFWRDNSSDTLLIEPRAAKGIAWTDSDIRSLLQLYNKHPEQIELAKHFPDRQWGRICAKLREHYGKRFHLSSYRPMKWAESYRDYVARTGENQRPLRATGVMWSDADDQTLLSLVNKRAKRVKIAAAFPYRTWRAIQDRIRRVAGKGIVIRGKGTVRLKETYAEYLARTGWVEHNSSRYTSDAADSDDELRCAQAKPTPFRVSCSPAISSSTTAREQVYASVRISTTATRKSARRCRRWPIFWRMEAGRNTRPIAVSSPSANPR